MANSQAEKMLLALLKSEGLVEWVGGYVFGETATNGHPFVILYPAAEQLVNKVCRVYQHDFVKLPGFIVTQDFQGEARSRTDPTQEEAVKSGIFHECPRFQVVLYHGRDTQMGREKRFSDVLFVSPRPQAKTATPEPALERPVKANGLTEIDWLKRAATAEEPFDFDTCIAKAWPFYETGANVTSTRDMLIGGSLTWDPLEVIAGLRKYQEQRLLYQGQRYEVGAAHTAAKSDAIAAMKSGQESEKELLTR